MNLGIDCGPWAPTLLLWLLATTPLPALGQQPDAPIPEAPVPKTSADDRPAQSDGRSVQSSQPPGYEAQIQRALTAYEKGQWASALRDFQLAHALLPTARTQRTIGMCFFNLGDFPNAIVSLERALATKERPLSAKQARQTTALVDQAMGEVTRVSVQIDGPFDTFLIDNAEPKRAQSGRLLVPPGIHLLRVEGPNVRPVKHGFTGNPGQELSISVTLAPLAVAPVTAAGPSQLPNPTQAANLANGTTATHNSAQTAGTDSGATLTTLGALSLSAGAAGLLTSGVMALLANGLRGDLKDACPEGNCPANLSTADDNRRARYSTYRTVSAVSFYGGAALVALGGVLILINDGEDGDEHQAGHDKNGSADSATLTLGVGPGMLSLRGSL